MPRHDRQAVRERLLGDDSHRRGDRPRGGPDPRGDARGRAHRRAHRSARSASSSHLSPLAGATATIAICMATYNSDPKLFRVQVESIRAQTDEDWVCLVGDDCSSPERFGDIEEIVGDDPRFIVLRSEERLGFYRNFERLLAAAPAGGRASSRSATTTTAGTRTSSPPCARRSRAPSSPTATSGSSTPKGTSARRRCSTAGARTTRTSPRSSISNTVAGRRLPRPPARGRARAAVSRGAGLGLPRSLARARLPLARADRLRRPACSMTTCSTPARCWGTSSRQPPRGRRRPEGVALGAARRSWRAGARPTSACYLQRDLQARVLLARCDAELTPRKRRALDAHDAGDALALRVRLARGRPLRRFAGRNETLGLESLLARAVIWRHLIGLAAPLAAPAGACRRRVPSSPSTPRASVARRRRWLAERG